MVDEIFGGCLCGKVRFKVSGPFDQFHFCHCSRCRKSTGSAHATNVFGKINNLQWLQGETFIKRFDLPAAKQFARSFCTDCGSPLPHRSGDTEILIIPAGALDTAPSVLPQDHIFWADRSEWYEASLEVQRFDRYPKRS